MRYILFIICYLLAPLAFSQQKASSNVELIGTPYGLYIKVDSLEQIEYTVFRKGKGEDFIQIGAHATVFTASDLYSKMTEFVTALPNFSLPKRTLVDTLWKYYKEDSYSITHFPYPLLQLGLGNAFLDTSAILGATYQYKIVFRDTINIETAETVYEIQGEEYSKMLFSQLKNVGTSVHLEWTVLQSNAPPYFEVYRKQAAGKENFKKINAIKGTHTNNTGDSMKFIVIDTTGVLGITYDYYLASFSYLGVAGTPSDTIRIQIGGRQNVPSIYNLRTRSDSNGIRLDWRKLSPNPAINNILVLRSESYDSAYKMISALPVDETQYIDRNVEGGKLYYYQLIVEGAANYSIPTPRVSGKFMGKIQLDSPYNLKSVSIKDGIKLSWRFAEIEKIKGFKVHRSLHPREGFDFIGEMVPLPKDSNIIYFVDTTIVDPNTTYYYSVAAVSNTSNLSPFSTVVSGQLKPTAQAQAPTGVRSLWLNDSTVSISWLNMEGTAEGVVGYKVYASKDYIESPTEENLIDQVEINEWVDILRPGESRWYWVKAINVSDVIGKTSSPIQIVAAIERPLPPEVVIYKQGESVLLHWENALNSNIKQYNIYRAVNDKSISLVGTVHAAEGSLKFTDDKVKAGNVYFYYITSVTKDKIESEFSKEIHMRY